MGVLAAIWTVFLVAFNSNQNVLSDSITGLGFAICFYYGFTGLACAWYFRRELFRSVRSFFLVGLLPLLGGGLLLGIPLMAICAVKFRGFFSRKTEVAPAGILDAPVAHAADHF